MSGRTFRWPWSRDLELPERQRCLCGAREARGQISTDHKGLIMRLDNSYGTAILGGLSVDRWHIVKVEQTKGQRGRFFLVPQEKHVYGGTVPYATVQRRRAANRTARKSRRVNRLRA